MTKQETIQVLHSIEDRAIDFPNMTECDWVAIAAAKRHLTEETVSEDLEEAAFDYAESCKYEGGDKLLCVEHFKAGAEWQKEKMLENAVDGIITFDYYSNDDKEYGCIAHDSFCLEDMDLKDRDKVKIAVIK